MHSSLACCLLAAAVPAACAFSSSPLPLTSRLYVTPRHAATAPASSAFGSLEHFIRHQPRVAALGGSPRLRGAARPGPAMAVESAPAGVPKAAGAAGKLAAADSEAPGKKANLRSLLALGLCFVALCPSLASAGVANQASAASGFFFNIRTPAALIAAGALKDAFVMTELAKKNAKFETPKWKRITNAYGLLMIISFGFELMTVFMGTAAGVRMLGGGYNPMAESPIAMLVREFEWDYVAVRCQFVSGILAFITAQALRVYVELHEKVFLARAVLAFLLFAATQCLAFFNAHLVFYGGYPELLARYLYLGTAGFFKGGLMPLLACGLLLASVFFMIASFIDTDGDGQLSMDELKEFWAKIQSSWADVQTKLQGKPGPAKTDETP